MKCDKQSWPGHYENGIARFSSCVLYVCASMAMHRRRREIENAVRPPHQLLARMFYYYMFAFYNVFFSFSLSFFLYLVLCAYYHLGLSCLCICTTNERSLIHTYDMRIQHSDITPWHESKYTSSQQTARNERYETRRKRRFRIGATKRVTE